jgi:hypothetical protein
VPTGVAVRGRYVYVSTLGAESPGAAAVWKLDGRTGKVLRKWGGFTSLTGTHRLVPRHPARRQAGAGQRSGVLLDRAMGRSVSRSRNGPFSCPAYLCGVRCVKIDASNH